MSQTNQSIVDFSFSTNPTSYKHLELKLNGDEAQIILMVNADKALRSDTKLKMNSYDLSVDIELADALFRLRFEHPKVRAVTIMSGHPQVFCSGANIYMLKKSSHAFKVNFCKFTNETRLYLEEASRYSHKKFLCAINGTAAGGGYELALACDRVILIDDKSAAVSLPEVPLLGVLPGTGGLTRLTDKRKIRRDLCDVFCTVAEGVKGQRAKTWGLVDEVYAKSQWDESVKQESAALKNSAISSKESESERGIELHPLVMHKDERGFSYHYVRIDIADRVAQIKIKGPDEPEPNEVKAMLDKGSRLWLLQAFRELDDAILRLRFFYRDVGLWQFDVEGDQPLILEAEKALYDAMKPEAHWFLRELLLHIARVYKRIDTSSRSLLCTLMPKSAYAGVLAELLFVADRGYAMIDRTKDVSGHIVLTPMNNGLLPTWNEKTRLAQRYLGQDDLLDLVNKKCNGQKIDYEEAYSLGLITFLLDEIDFEDDLRLFKEERASLSPDALSAMESNLRYGGPETLATKIFGRLSAWQNWVFTRENAAGPTGALTSYGEDQRACFTWERC